MSHNKTSFKDWKEARRKRAFELKELGWKPGDIAQALGVSAPAVCKWLSKVNAEPGVEAWRSKPARSGPLKLTPEQLRLIPDFLSHGAEAYGFRGEVWTCARVAKVFEEEFGVTYHRGHVARLLKALEMKQRSIGCPAWFAPTLREARDRFLPRCLVMIICR